MVRFFLLTFLLLLFPGLLQAQVQDNLILIPETVTHVPGIEQHYTVTVLDVDASFDEDVDVFLPDTTYLKMEGLQRRGKDQILIDFCVSGETRTLGPVDFFIRTGDEKSSFKKATLHLRGSRIELESAQVRTNGGLQDSLDLSRPGLEDFDLVLESRHFYKGSQIVFEDSTAFVMQRIVSEETPGLLIVHIDLEERKPHGRNLKFDIRHPHAPTLFEASIPVRSYPPKIIDVQPSRLQAGSTRERITLIGEGFAEGATVRIPEIPSGDVSTPNVKATTLEFDARIPVDMPALTVIVENEDGQMARRNVPISRALQPASATVRNRFGRIFFGQQQRVEFRPDGDHAFEARRRFVLSIEGLKPVSLQPRSSGVIQTEILLPADTNAYDATGRIEKPFTISTMDGAREWSGLLDFYLAPRIRREAPIVIRPGEQKKVRLSGLYLSEATLASDSGIIQGSKALTDHTLEVTLKAGTDAPVGPFEIYLVRDNVRFQTLKATVEAWAEPGTYVQWGWDKRTQRDLKAWNEENGFLASPSNGQLIFNLRGDLLPENVQPQNVHVEVRNNAINAVLHTSRYRLTHGMQEAILVDLEGKVEPEQTLRVAISTPQDSTNFNLVRIVKAPRERWDIAAGASVVRVAFNGDVQVLNSVGIGATYALDQKDDIGLNFGGLFIGYESRVVDFGLTSSLTFFKRLTLGFGWNMFGPGAKTAEGSLLERRGFMIVGGTFNLALP